MTDSRSLRMKTLIAHGAVLTPEGAQHFEAVEAAGRRLLAAYEQEEAEHGFPFNMELRAAHRDLAALLATPTTSGGDTAIGGEPHQRAVRDPLPCDEGPSPSEGLTKGNDLDN